MARKYICKTKKTSYGCFDMKLKRENKKTMMDMIMKKWTYDNKCFTGKKFRF